MRRHGQILLVRPLIQSDLPDLERMTGSPGLKLPSRGLLGRLAGEPVGFVAFSNAGGELSIDRIFVAADLRRKRIGRGLMIETEQLARRLNCNGLVVSAQCEAREFFTRLGFEEENSLLRKSIRAR